MEENSSARQERVGIRIASSSFTVAPGGSVDIPITLFNQASEDDAFELSLQGIPSNWMPVPSPVTRLSAGEQQELRLTIQPPAAPYSRVGRYPLTIRVTSRTDPGKQVEVPVTLTVAGHEVEARIGALIASTHFSVVPGGGTTIPVVLINQGLEPDYLQLSVEGIPSGWVSTPSAVTHLAPGEQREVSLTIQPPRSVQSRAGRHPFKIQVASQSTPGQFTVLDCTLTIAAFDQFRSELRPQHIAAGQTAWVTVENRGNIPQTFTIVWQSQDDALIFKPADKQRLHVPAGEAATVQFRAVPRRRRLFGEEETYALTARVRSPEKESQNLSAEVVSQGLIPVWLVPLVAILVMAFACVVVILAVRPGFQEPRVTDTPAASATAIPTATLENDSDADGLTDQREIELGTDPFNPDMDADGLMDGDEVNRGTDPLNPDTDGDGLSDGDEVARGTNPLNVDTDGDRLIDGDEVVRGTDPLNPDTDGDALSDSDEVARGTSPLNPDTDGDGLSDGDEVTRGTNPLNADTDSDGLSDGDEVARGTNPLVRDTDSDVLSDGDEVNRGTDPLSPDTDKDGLTDGDEVARGTDPVNLDTDGDGLSDGDEVALGTDPLDPNDPPRPATVTPIQTPTETPTITPTPQPATETSTPTPTEEPTSTWTPTPTATPTATPTGTPTPLPIQDQGVIAFESNRDGNSEIYMLRTSDLTVSRLTNDPGVDTQPAWSSDGSRVAFATNRDGNFEIYVMSADGTQPINLTNDAADDRYPVWSPDDQWIAFTTNRDGNQEIYIMRSDGSEAQNLTDDPAEDYQPTWFAVSQLFSTAEGIAFTSNRDGNQEIYRMKTDGSEQVNLTNNAANDFYPSWSGNGDRIAFTSNRDGNQEIYVMNGDGTDQVNLTKNPAEDQTPTWSPNDQWIAFTTNRVGNQEIYVIPSGGDGVQPFNLTANPAQDLFPAWLE